MGKKVTDAQATLDDWIFIPLLQPGDKLYHYTSAAGLKGIVDGEFWITERHFLNDSTEFQIGTEIFCEMLRKNIKDKDVAERMEKVIRQEAKRMTAQGTVDDTVAFNGDFVISFCLDEDSILMWSEYSDFMGYSLKFDFEKFLSAIEERLFFHGKVIYDHYEQLSYMEKSFRLLIMDWHKGFEYINTWDDFENMTDDQMEELAQFAYVICDVYNMFFKKECFAGEHEYRFVFPYIHEGGRVKESEYVPVYFRIEDEVLIPFVKKEFDCKDSMEGVIVGPKNNSDIAIAGLEYFFRSKRMKIDIRKSEMPLRY